jgi:hypothetical protein
MRFHVRLNHCVALLTAFVSLFKLPPSAVSLYRHFVYIATMPQEDRLPVILFGYDCNADLDWEWSEMLTRRGSESFYEQSPLGVKSETDTFL